MGSLAGWVLRPVAPGCGEAELDAGEEELAPIAEFPLIGEPCGCLVPGPFLLRDILLDQRDKRPAIGIREELVGDEGVALDADPPEAHRPEPSGERLRQRRMGEVSVKARSTRSVRVASEECRDTVAQSTSQTTRRPPGRRTRCSSARAASGSATYSSTCTARAASKAASGTGRAVASAKWSSTLSWPCVRCLARARVWGLASMPTSDPVGPTCSISSAR